MAPRYAEYEGGRYVAVIRGISPVNPPRIIYLRAVAISILMEWGVVMGSSILVWVRAVVTFSSIGWEEVFPRGRRVSGIAYREG